MALQPRHYIIGLIGAATLAGLGWIGFRTEPVPVDIAKLARGPMMVTVNADGETRIHDVFDVATPIFGTARRAPVEVGDPVIAGETVVAVVEPAAPALLDARSRQQAQAAVQEAEAALRFAEAQLLQTEEELAHAQSQYDRAQTLAERGVTSLTQLEDAAQILSIRLAAREAAQSNVAMSTSALRRARAALIEPGAASGPGEQCCITLRAPITGTVLSVDIVSERPVLAGTRLVSLGRTDDLEIVADLLSADAVGLEPGVRAIVERWGGPVPLEATLRRVEPSARTKVSALGIEEQRVDAIFDITSPPETRKGLGDGFAVYLRIVTWEGADVLQVPLSALFRREGQWAVFREMDGGARLTPVTIGRRNGTAAEVTEGLAPGDRVILHPSDAIAEGTPVTDRGAH
ncbi:HlyD family efflux transporter periplasmic adaptor subunit [Defluviimonas sp. WL0024]|uniref:HlyD family efflux transporter periplasmic adaptor subunit n=1 Tax=Albidovulum salinarum TaxID=2984153 RepID=A0ABT2X032_9RHOB|nr:HlyD family efflux transporter periplasmic adaptor subunit [Defluviimonas sp. WL0024]MCU9847281.1 HlyD family efflux transporter periplasmic adaptor subunit [Defluviimonas sp. WL0024]